MDIISLVKNHWQEYFLASGQILFILFLIPTIKNKEAKLPKLTSKLTGYMLFGYALTYFSLHFYYPAITACLASITWLWISNNRSI